MANWQHKIELNQIIQQVSEDFDLSRLEEPCPEQARNALATEIEKAPPLTHFGPKIRDAKSIAEVNRLLEAIFSAADHNLVWCGL